MQFFIKTWTTWFVHFVGLYRTRKLQKSQNYEILCFSCFYFTLTIIPIPCWYPIPDRGKKFTCDMNASGDPYPFWAVDRTYLRHLKLKSTSLIFSIGVKIASLASGLPFTLQGPFVGERAMAIRCRSYESLVVLSFHEKQLFENWKCWKIRDIYVTSHKWHFCPSLEGS